MPYIRTCVEVVDIQHANGNVAETYVEQKQDSAGGGGVDHDRKSNATSEGQEKGKEARIFGAKREFQTSPRRSSAIGVPEIIRF